MTSRRDLNQELFGQDRFGHPTASPLAALGDATREVSLSELAELSELTEEQAKVGYGPDSCKIQP